MEENYNLIMAKIDKEKTSDPYYIDSSGKKITVHQYSLWIPMDIYLKLYKIQEEKGCATHSINNQINEILKKHYESV